MIFWTAVVGLVWTVLIVLIVVIWKWALDHGRGPYEPYEDD